MLMEGHGNGKRKNSKHPNYCLGTQNKDRRQRLVERRTILSERLWTRTMNRCHRRRDYMRQYRAQQALLKAVRRYEQASATSVLLVARISSEKIRFAYASDSISRPTLAL